MPRPLPLRVPHICVRPFSGGGDILDITQSELVTAMEDGSVVVIDVRGPDEVRIFLLCWLNKDH